MLVPIPGFIKSIYATRFQVLNCIDMVQDPIFNHILFTQKTPGNTVGRKFQFKGLFCFCPLSLWMGCKMSIHKISPLFVCLWTSSSHNFPLCSLEHHPFSPLVCPLLNAHSLLMRVHLYNDQGTDSLDRLSERRPSQWSPSERRPSLDRMKTVRRGTSLNIDYLNTEFHTSVMRYRDIEVLLTNWKQTIEGPSFHLNNFVNRDFPYNP